MKLNAAKTNNIIMNKEGSPAYEPTAYNKLYLQCASALFGEPKFYGDNTPEIINNIKSMFQTDPEFVLKLAIFCKKELNLRTMPIVMLVEACNATSLKGNSTILRQAGQQIITRADGLTELLSYHLHAYGKPIPKSIKLILADGLNSFDEYELGKYKKTKSNVKLKDVLFLSHPKPKNAKQQELFNAIATDTLTIPFTWETFISKNGSSKESWSAVVPKMGIMAKLRNLRNFLDNDVDPKFYLTDFNTKDIILKSKQFPFRFYSAHKMLRNNNNLNTTKVLDALETAIEYSIENIPKIPGKTLIAADNSGSMSSTVSGKSKLELREIANLMASFSNKVFDESIVSSFGEDFKIINLSKRNVLSNVDLITQLSVGYATNGWKVARHLLDNKIFVDRVIIFTDMQLWDNTDCYCDSTTLRTAWSTYKKEVNSNAKLYLVDLAGYGTIQFPEHTTNIVNIGGWSENIFDFIIKYEQDISTTIDYIKRLTFRSDIDDR